MYCTGNLFSKLCNYRATVSFSMNELPGWFNPFCFTHGSPKTVRNETSHRQPRLELKIPEQVL